MIEIDLVVPAQSSQLKNVTELINESSNPLIWQGSKALDMSKDSYHRAVLEAGFRAFKSIKIQKLSEDDFDKREEFCETLRWKV